MPMSHVYFRFYGDLTDLLPSGQLQPIPVPLYGPAAVKHPIEALGVPHPEVAALVANGHSVDFTYLLHADDQIEVYPATVQLPLVSIVPLRPPLPQPVRFVLDTHLGQLATYLRLFGFDTLYRNDYDDPALAQLSNIENRLLLTRDRGLLKRKLVIYGHCVRSSDSRQQLLAVLRRYQLQDQIQPWQRCLRCNELLVMVDKAAILAQLAPKTRLYYDEFRRCPYCGQIYWQGSHHAHMAQFMTAILAELATS